MKKIVLMLALFGLAISTVHAEDSADQFKGQLTATLTGADATVMGLEPVASTVTRITAVEFSAAANMTISVHSGTSDNLNTVLDLSLPLKRLIDGSGTEVTATNSMKYWAISSGTLAAGTEVRKFFIGANQTKTIDLQWFQAPGEKLHINANGTGDLVIRPLVYERAQ